MMPTSTPHVKLVTASRDIGEHVRVQKCIHLFGGDPSQVTIAGESAGAGSGLLQAMAYGGSQGQSLFRYAIAQSPYVHKQYKYNEDFPTAQYDKFVAAVGCSNVTGNKLPCLRSKPCNVLTEASNNASSTVASGTWAFLPVTDTSLNKHPPSKQLLERRPMNGERSCIGSNADEGTSFVPQNMTTMAHVKDYIRTIPPRFTAADISDLSSIYTQTEYALSPDNPRLATSGDHLTSTLDVSPTSISPQQHANVIYGELTIICPSYYKASSFSHDNRTAYKYQHSVPAALHGSALSAYLGPPRRTQSADLAFAWRCMFGAFVASGTPNIPDQIANGASTKREGRNAAEQWPVWGKGARQMDFNQTRGRVVVAPVRELPSLGDVTQIVEPGLRNEFGVVDAWEWESGRGRRWEFWRRKAARLPF